MKLEKAVTRAQTLRDLWKMDIHIMNELDELNEYFGENYFCVIDINLYIYIHHSNTKNQKVYYTAQYYSNPTYSILT